MTTRDGAAGVSFEWSQEWVDPPTSTLVMAHTGIALTRAGLIMTGATGDAALVLRGRNGDISATATVADASDLHDLALVEDDAAEHVWIADTATRLYGGARDLDIRRLADSGQVLKIDLEGNTLMKLATPAIAAYETTGYRPTAVAVDEVRFGGSGDIWVADGYGASLLHRYGADGRYLATISGEDGAGQFREPHDVLIDRRRGVPELYVTDRVNGRIQVFDLEGQFLRVFGEGVMPGPTQMSVGGEMLVVTDLLCGRLSVFDPKDQFVTHLFAEPTPPTAWDALPDAWPNARSADGTLTAAPLRSGAFHTPHGVAVDADGTIYVSEFAIGGRIAVLTPGQA